MLRLKFFTFALSLLISLAARADVDTDAGGSRRTATAERSARRIAATDQPGENKHNITTLLPMPPPAPVEEIGGGSDIDDEHEHGEGEKADSSDGISFITILIFMIPVLGIVNFFGFRTLRNNQVEDFVPVETDDDE